MASIHQDDTKDISGAHRRSLFGGTLSVGPYRHVTNSKSLSQHAAEHQHHHHNNDAGGGGLQFYASCWLAGGLSSGIRWVLTPFELVKTRAQVMDAAASSSTVTTAAAARRTAAAPAMSTSTALHAIYTEEGPRALFRGLGPTAAAYWFQTSTKYSLYEVLKEQYTELATGLTGKSDAELNKGLVYVTAAATAEAVASVLMCPFEMQRVKVMSSQPGVPAPTLRAGLLELVSSHNRVGRITSTLFGSLGPLWARQIPCTVVNFFMFERVAQYIYGRLLDKSKDEYNTLQQLGVTFVAGYTAGTCAAVVSHPADSLVSLAAVHRGKTAFEIANQVGLYKLATRGIGPRIFVTGKIISVQWLLYDSVKSFLGFGTTGG